MSIITHYFFFFFYKSYEDDVEEFIIPEIINYKGLLKKLSCIMIIEVMYSRFGGVTIGGVEVGSLVIVTIPVIFLLMIGGFSERILEK